MPKNKRHTLNAITVFVFLVVLLLISASSYLISWSENGADKLKANIEMQNRQHTRGFLLYLNDKLTQDVLNGRVDINDEESISNWASHNIRTINSDSTYANFSLIKVNYDRKQEEFIGKYLWSATAQKVDSDLGYKTTFDILVNQKKAKEYFASNNNALANQELISYSDIVGDELLKEEEIDEMEKKNIIRYNNPSEVQSTLNAMYQGSVSGNNDNYTWTSHGNENYYIEWTTVPLESTIGLNDQPKTIKGKINPKYERIIIVTAIDSEYVQKPFNSQFDQFSVLQNIVHTAIIIFVAASLVLMLYLVKVVGFDHKKQAKEQDK
jgi:hypothetical protein